MLNSDVAALLSPAYAPCTSFREACSTLRWSPDEGHVPRGFCGATGRIEEVELVLVYAEPGNPHDGEVHTGIESTVSYTYECFKSGTDLFHRNVRILLDMCFPGLSFDDQLRKAWLTESLLCSAPREGGAVSAAAWRACSRKYLMPQLKLFRRATVVALGNKAQKRLSSMRIKFIPAASVAPPGCNFRSARQSWEDAAKIFRNRRSQ